jgi:hypothetical protein
MNTILIADVGTEDTGRTKTWLTVSKNYAPKGSYTLVVSTTFSKAKDPEAHMTKIKLNINSQEKLHQIGNWLASM